MSNLNEIKEIIEAQGAEFAKYGERLAALEVKAGRPALFGSKAHQGSETPEQRELLAKGIKSLLAGSQANADRYFAELKAMSVGSDPDGGYVVTPSFSDEMTRIMLEISPFIGLARTVEIASDTFEEPVDKDSAGAEWVNETASRSDSDTPELALFRCPVHEIYAQPAVTQKLIDVAHIDIVSWLRGKVAEKFAYTETDAFFNGNGVARPRGFLTYTTAATADASRAWGELEHVKSGANGDFASSNPADKLIDLVSRMKPQYRKGAVWLMNSTTEAAVRKLKDSQNQYLWVTGIAPGQPNSLLGYPVITAEQMPDLATNSLSVAFGNFRKGYTIVRRLGVRFLLDPYTSKPNVRLYTYSRVGGAVNNFEAVKLLKFSA